MNLIYNLEENIDITKNTIFLAGPTSRSDCSNSWRKKAIQYLNSNNFDGNIIIPEPRYNNFNIDTFDKVKQIEWERKWLHYSNVILFWIPRSIDLPGFTTNIEFGEWFKSDKTHLGYPNDATNMDYIKYIYTNYSNNTLSNTLESLVDDILLKFNRPSKIYFTSDTHFSSERTLELSKRPFKNILDMDYTIISNWNSLVYSHDIIYHLGDFGSPNIINTLSAERIFLLEGNYDNDEFINNLRREDKLNRVIIKNEDVHESSSYSNRWKINDDITLIHEPENGIDSSEFYLYGHIHQLQTVKKNGLNVGTDCHKFKPIDMDIVNFYKTAINKFYDDNVFMQVLTK